MAKWSEELQERTRKEIFPLAVVKNEDHAYGIVMTTSPKVIINAIQESSFMPLPSEKVIATFDNVTLMVEAGWVLD